MTSSCWEPQAPLEPAYDTHPPLCACGARRLGDWYGISTLDQICCQLCALNGGRPSRLTDRLPEPGRYESFEQFHYRIVPTPRRPGEALLWTILLPGWVDHKFK